MTFFFNFKVKMLYYSKRLIRTVLNQINIDFYLLKIYTDYKLMTNY